MRNLLSLLLTFFCMKAFAFDSSKLTLSAGYFALNAKAAGKSTSISNPSAFNTSYQRSFADSWEWKAGYTILLSDYSGSDMGYGFDGGVNYYPMSSASDGKYSDDKITVKRYQEWSPFVGVGFYQRNFQSVRNSYAGLGFNGGVERYYTEKINFKIEAKHISLGGSSGSKATEATMMFGIVFKL